MNWTRAAASCTTLALMAAGCASTSAQPPAAPVASPPPAAATAAQVTPTSQSAALSDKAAAAVGTHDALVKSARTMGYKLRQDKNGDPIYCHTEAELGSRFEKTSCITEDNMKQRIQDMIETQEYMRTAPNRCAGSTCGTTN